MRPFALALAAVPMLAATSALADPCTADLPVPGTRFSGVVRYVGDGDSLCVGPAGRPDRWIEIRLGDFNAPELHDGSGEDAKRRLRRVAMGKSIAYRADHRSYDRIVAYCTIGRRRLGDALRAAGGREGGR